jgi:hypothetical protein
MKVLVLFPILGIALLSGAYAYPSYAFTDLIEKKALHRSLNEALKGDFFKRAGLPAVIDFPDNFGLANEGRPYIFDQRLQHIDLVHNYPWKEPGPSDQRGPCAG